MTAVKPPLCICGVTKDDGFVFGGAFQMADTHGLPLSFSIDKARSMGCAISIPHYFASAIEHGWDDRNTFAHIKEAMQDCGLSEDFEAVKKACIVWFMALAHRFPEDDAVAIACKMRKRIESDAYAEALVSLWEEFGKDKFARVIVEGAVASMKEKSRGE